MQKEKLFNSFIGIDVSKAKLDIHYRNKHLSISNNKKSINKFIKEISDNRDDTLVIIDLTGGYESTSVECFYEAGFNVHRAEGRRVKSFIRSLGEYSKTDKIDAKMLSYYGEKFQENLRLFSPQERDWQTIKSLVNRREDLKAMLQQEKNRLSSPSNFSVKQSHKKLIKVLEKDMLSLEEEINNLISKSEFLSKKKEIMTNQIGVGEKVSNIFLAEVPELGYLNRRQIASLVGVAPRAKDSGNYAGYRKTGGGRKRVKKALFIAALVAIRYDKNLQAFYERLVSSGKKKMVAITAVMRKIIVILNAKIKEYLLEQSII